MCPAELVDEAPADDPGQGVRAQLVSQLFREHNRALVGFLMARLGNEAEAKELAQEAYVRILDLEQPGAISFLRAYLFRVANNLAVDRIRQRHIRDRLDEVYLFDELLAEPMGERAAIAQEEVALLRRALAELPPRYALAFRRVKLEEAPIEEVARDMGLGVRMVRKYLSRALVFTELRSQGRSVDEARARAGL